MRAKIVKGYAQSYFTAIGELRAMVTRETWDGLELRNSAEIIIATNSYRQARGRTILLALLDECAFWRDETSATPDIETYRAILPALATLPRAMLVGLSSPYRKAGLLYDKWKAHFGKDDDRVLSFRPSRRNSIRRSIRKSSPTRSLQIPPRPAPNGLDSSATISAITFPSN